MYSDIIFDLDDTLIDNSENIRQGFKIVLEFVGEEYTIQILNLKNFMR